jgi:non-ribosomal peptide synthetase component F
LRRRLREPDAVAVVFEDQRLTYAELDARANQVAHHLRGIGVGPEVLVGLCLERSLEMLVGLIGILKAGGAYLPLDPSYPHERLGHMLSDTDARVVISDRAQSARLPTHAARIVLIDADRPAIAALAPATRLLPANAAYIIYTSGSTGIAKGVAVSHASLVNRVAAAGEDWRAVDCAGWRGSLHPGCGCNRGQRCTPDQARR